MRQLFPHPRDRGPQAPPEPPRVLGTKASPLFLCLGIRAPRLLLVTLVLILTPMVPCLSMSCIRVASVLVSTCLCVCLLVHVARGDAVACMQARSRPRGV